jgi:hypothetical protein
MTAYNDITPKVAGLKQALGSRVLSKTVKETSGIEYGYPVFGYEGNDTDCFLFHNNVGVILFDADFVASNSIVITVDGTAVTAVPFNTSHTQTMTDLKEQIQADIAGATVTLTDATNNRELTITIEDDAERVVAEAVTGGASQPSGTISYSSSQVFLGLTLKTDKGDAVRTDLNGNVLSASTAYYALTETANVAIDAIMTIVTGSAVTSEKQAYVVATGAEQGKITDVSTSNTILAGVFIKETVASAGLADVRINK